MVRRLVVAKRPQFDTRSPAVFHELHDVAGIAELRGIRVARRYDVEGVPEALWDRAVREVFADPAEDELLSGEGALTVAYLPGQFDQRAEAAEQALALLGAAEARVRVADLYFCAGELSAASVGALEAALINPVEAQRVSDELPETLVDRDVQPSAPRVLPEFLDPLERRALCAALGLAMSEEDAAAVADYFTHTAARAPTETELRLLDTYWSDHCRHTTFTTALDLVPPESGPLGASWQLVQQMRSDLHRDGPLTLMELATLPMRWARARGLLDDVVFSEEVNACTVRIAARIGNLRENWLVLFKNETHNHPTEIEPFGGAATCLGGAIRDPLSGRAYVYQALRVTGAADPRRDGTPRLPGKLPQRTITRGAAAGYSSYGNQIGLATGIVEEYYHPGYAAKRLEVGAVIGAVREDLVRRETPQPGDVVLLIGGRTGRDGIGGATGSSQGHTRRSIERAGAEVQKGNPPAERALQRLFRLEEFARCVKRCNDFGAGGVAVAVGEIAAGVDIDLDAVPRKYQGLSATETAISESQERMAVVVAAADVGRVTALAASQNVECTVIAQIIAAPRLRMRSGGAPVAEIERSFLDSAGAPRRAAVDLAAPRVPDAPAHEDVSRLPQRLAELQFGSRRGLAQLFDPSIGARTVIAPYGGVHQRTPAEAMVALLPAAEAQTATVMAHGFNPELSAASPYHGAYAAVVEAVSRAVAAGADARRIRLSLQEYFPSPRRDPQRWGVPTAALLGALQAQHDLGVYAIGGKDSMSGSYEALDVPPTLIAFAVGTTERAVSAHLQRDGGAPALIAPAVNEWGIADPTQLKTILQELSEATAGGKPTAVRALRAGGVAVALAQMAFGDEVGLAVDAAVLDRRNVGPFAALYGGFIVQLARGTALATALPRVVAAGLAEGLGAVVSGGEAILQWGNRRIAVAELYRCWSSPLADVFPDPQERQAWRGEELCRVPAGKTADASPRPPRASKPGIARPLVVIPVFPGSNCEDDSELAFARAGAVVRTVVVRNRTIEMLHDSLRELATALAAAQILMIPGGFSAGDEPGGSGKFIAAVLHAPPVREVIERDFVAGDRLILGICNGFQGLVRTGLVPFGRYLPRRHDHPALAPNVAGHHLAYQVVTRVAVSGGPWTQLVAVGDLCAEPISHGEGRFLWDAAAVAQLFGRGQVATQYVDYQGVVQLGRPWNPNGSVAGIEGVSSPDGRFLGKMAHSERVRPGVMVNLPQLGSLRLFESGVRYFA